MKGENSRQRDWTVWKALKLEASWNIGRMSGDQSGWHGEPWQRRGDMPPWRASWTIVRDSTLMWWEMGDCYRVLSREVTDTTWTHFFFFGLTAWLVGSQFPDRGSKPKPRHWKPGILTTGLPGNSWTHFFKTKKYFLKWKSSYCTILYKLQAYSRGFHDF